MDEILIMLTSITYAMKGKDILERYGINSYIQRTPSHSRLNGCGYSLLVPKKSQEAYNILIKHNIKVIGISRRSDNK